MTDHTAKLTELVAWLHSEYDRTLDELDLEAWVGPLSAYPYPSVKRAILTGSRDQFFPRLGRILELVAASLPSSDTRSNSCPETLMGRYVTLGYCVECHAVHSEQHWRENTDHTRRPVRSTQCLECQGPTPCNCAAPGQDFSALPADSPWMQTLKAARDAGLEAADDERVESGRRQSGSPDAG